jgi:hypothetical protein
MTIQPTHFALFALLLAGANPARAGCAVATDTRPGCEEPRGAGKPGDGEGHFRHGRPGQPGVAILPGNRAEQFRAAPRHLRPEAWLPAGAAVPAGLRVSPKPWVGNAAPPPPHLRLHVLLCSWRN